MLSELPAVYEVLERLPEFVRRFPRDLVVEEVRRAIADLRDELRSGAEPGVPLEDRVIQGLRRLESPSLRRVINATGVVLHTNLGRAPLGRTRNASPATPTSNTTSPQDARQARRSRRRASWNAWWARPASRSTTTPPPSSSPSTNLRPAAKPSSRAGN